MKIKTSKLNKTDIEDFLKLLSVFIDVFNCKDFIPPTEKHLQTLLNNDNFLVFVATVDSKIIGGLTAHVLGNYYSEKRSAYIYDLAVTANFQRKGIGSLLIATFNEYCLKNNFYEVFVQAETDDVETINFYRTTLISKELKATQFTYSMIMNN